MRAAAGEYAGTDQPGGAFHLCHRLRLPQRGHHHGGGAGARHHCLRPHGGGEDSATILLFFVPDKAKTFAQMTQEEKAAISHRGKALREFTEKLETYLEKEPS